MEFWESFWSIIWWFVWAFVFVAYLMVLFSIIGDIFRDRELGGFAKAVWVFCLIFFPFITALVYLIARGSGMAERGAAADQRHHEALLARLREVGVSSPSVEIEKAAQMREQGTITEYEFQSLKARVLA
ncbi:SHOCT domain-containing protein [Nesterenkonia sp. E16_7]|uniref:SHOCT domain-containing protein n=1 Tax=unclassified Nesterenkonia TaxID=2629769 RepID=UPI001A9365E0|nr:MULTISPECIES: SHOCT domain-containing protein [unclassified Nesterenkonia]MBO0595624.1 SHOCT domain-containing protein [Nesterenkonia sp. E16_10]MBO0598569.1 SHOCT domain-containing protein [Nesterenkonia sp. E16_7]